MKKLHIVCALLLAAAFAQPAFAQLKKFSFGPYAEVAFPSGNTADIATTGYGAGLSMEVSLPVKLSATASFGLMHFGGKDVPGTSFSYPATNALPLRVGAKYRLSSVFYGAMETGAVFPTKKGGSSSALLAPAIGARFLTVDVRFKYEAWLQEGSAKFWALQAALRF